MKKIVHFGKYYFPDAGGVESVTLSLAKGAVAAGHQVAVICFKKTPGQDAETLHGVAIQRAPIVKMLASQPLGWKYVTQCLREARQADVVHMHAPNMIAALCCLLMSKRPRLLVHWHSDVINKGLLGLLARPLELALLRRADRIVATSQVYADASQTLQLFKEKIQVVPIGIDAQTNVNCTGDGDAALPAELAERIKDRQVVLAVGRLVPYKGFNVLIEAAKMLPDDSIVVIVGSGPLQEQLAKKIEAEGIGHRVYMAGRLGNGALHALFARARLYCLPSVYRAEAFGVVLLEAMAHGLPIVATEIPGSGVPWVNQQSVSGLNVPVENPGALADACNRILYSEELRRRLSEGARQRYLSEFTEQVSVRRMLQTYSLLEK
jgi:glycosyltransferase involved in cell wall biosynthesis